MKAHLCLMDHTDLTLALYFIYSVSVSHTPKIKFEEWKMNKDKTSKELNMGERVGLSKSSKRWDGSGEIEMKRVNEEKRLKHINGKRWAVPTKTRDLLETITTASKLWLLNFKLNSHWFHILFYDNFSATLSWRCTCVWHSVVVMIQGARNMWL